MMEPAEALEEMLKLAKKLVMEAMQEMMELVEVL